MDSTEKLIKVVEEGEKNNQEKIKWIKEVKPTREKEVKAKVVKMEMRQKETIYMYNWITKTKQLEIMFKTIIFFQ